MVFQAPMYQQDEGEGVRFYPLFLCIFICITRIHYVCLSLSVLITNTYMGPIGDSGNRWIICGTFLRKEKMAFFFLHIPEIEEIFKHF